MMEYMRMEDPIAAVFKSASSLIVAVVFVFCSLYIVWLPGYLAYVIIRSRINEALIKEHTHIFSDLRTADNAASAYQLITTLKKLAIILLLVFATEHAYWQCMCILVIYTLNFTYLFTIKPFSTN